MQAFFDREAIGDTIKRLDYKKKENDMKKKLLYLICVGIIGVSLVGCSGITTGNNNLSDNGADSSDDVITAEDSSETLGDENIAEETIEKPKYDFDEEDCLKLGETGYIYNDSEVTLNECKFAYALENTTGKTYMTPIPVSETNSKNIFNAEVGSTLVYFSLNNGMQILMPSSVTVYYNGKEYSGSNNKSYIFSTDLDTNKRLLGHEYGFAQSANSAVMCGKSYPEMRGFVEIPVDEEKITGDMYFKIQVYYEKENPDDPRKKDPIIESLVWKVN